MSAVRGLVLCAVENEHEDQELALRDRKTCFIFLISAAASLVIFGVLKLLFPFTV